jgi:hypothetical protein
MNPQDLDWLAVAAPLATGYRFEPLQRHEIGLLVSLVTSWFPEISVGGASCYLREDFYTRKIIFADAPEREGIVLLLKHGDAVCGMFACKLDYETLSVYAGLGVADPRHRGAGLAQGGMIFTEALGRHLGMGFVYGMATLRNPYVQQAFEKAGWQLLGIMPGYDRELIAPNTVKRVYEAIYARVLVAGPGLQCPDRRNLTPLTRSLYDCVFPTSPNSLPSP